MATKARQQYFADEISLQKDSREFSIEDSIKQKIDSVEAWAQVNTIETVKVNWTALTPDANKAVDVEVPEVIDNLYTTSTDDALSAKQWKVLYDYIQNIASRWRFLSNWNSATGLPMTNPSESPYTYRTWDYFIVSNIAWLWGTNYRPDGSSYIIWQASTVAETDSVDVSDFYFYDGTNWLLLKNSARSWAVDSSLSTSSTNPVENRVVTNALNWKQEILIAWNNIQIAADWKTISATDTTYSAASSSSLWLVKLGSDTVQSVSANAVTGTAGRTYAMQVNSSWQLVVNIPRTDTTYTASSFDIKDIADSTSLRSTWSWKQDALTTQTAYTTKGTSTKVPTISTNTLWQVTAITETSIDFPVTSVNWDTWAVTLDADDISDSTTTNKFVTASDKSTWSGKQDALTLPSTPTSWHLVTWGGDNKTLADWWVIPTGVPSGWNNWDVLTNVSWAPTWQAPSGWDVMVSSQSWNILTSWMKIWAWTETNYTNLWTYDSNCLYLTIE